MIWRAYQSVFWPFKRQVQFSLVKRLKFHNNLLVVVSFLNYLSERQ